MATIAILSAAAAESEGDWVTQSGPVQRNSVTGKVRLDPSAYQPDVWLGRTDSAGNALNSYGLTDAQMVEFERMQDSGNAGIYVTIAEATQIRDSGLGPHTDAAGVLQPGATLAEKQTFVQKLEETTPLPTNFTTPEVLPTSILAKEAALKPIDAGVISAVPVSTAQLSTQIAAPDNTVRTMTADGGSLEVPASSDSETFSRIALFVAAAGLGLLLFRTMKGRS